MSKQKKHSIPAAAPKNKQLGGAPTIDRAENKQLKAPTSILPSRKKVSQKVKSGDILLTRDEYIEDGYIKQGYENGKGGNYRKLLVTDTNKKNEAAGVRLTTSKKGIPLPESGDPKTRFRPYLHTRDNEGKPIKAGSKFIPSKKERLNDQAVKKVKREVGRVKDTAQKLKDFKNR